MIPIRFWLCLLLPTLFATTCFSDDAIKYQTDWILPLIEFDGKKTGLRNTAICAIDLGISPSEPNGWTGTIKLYTGVPTLDRFGDAKRSTLPSRRIPVTFRKLEIAKTPIDELYPPKPTTGEIYYSDDDPTLSHIRLVMDSEKPNDCRILIMASDGNIRRVLPLQSERLLRLSEQTPKSNPSMLDLFSGPIVSDQEENGMSTLSIKQDKDQISLLEDLNNLGLDRLGNIQRTTLLGFGPATLDLIDLNLPDATGQERRVFRCEVAARKDDRRGGDQKSEPYTAGFLVLHPREGGWHRFIRMKSGKVELVAPLHSRQLENWLHTSSRITDATERQVFEKISQEIPYFNGFSFEDGRITRVTIFTTEGKENLLEVVARLPHLTSLQIIGDLADGSSLVGFESLESLSFAGGRITEDILRHVRQLPKLKSLAFDTDHLDCNALKHLSGMQSLNHFHFQRGKALNFDDSCVEVFSTLPNLESLGLHALTLTEVGIRLLPVSERLAKVSFSDDAPIPAVLNYAKSNPQAEIDTSSGCIRIADGFLNLRSRVTDEDLELLATDDGVRDLDLGGVSSKNITDMGLAYLSKLKPKSFGMRHNQNITDTGIGSLAEIQSLQELNFWRCKNLTNQCIPELEKLPNLKRINIGGTQIDPNVLRQSIPNCDIRHD